MRPDHLIKRALIPDLHRLLYGPVLDDEEAPLLRIRAIGRALSRLEDRLMSASGTGSGSRRRIARVVWMISKSSVASTMKYTCSR
jgi:hypothetical protein